jgi:hypothetical protein
MRKILISMGITMTILEIVNAPMISAPAAAIVFALLFAGCTWWFYKKNANPALIILSLLFLLEIVSIPGYPRTNARDWIMQSLTAIFSVIGLIGAFGTFKERRKAKSETR